MSEGRKNPYAYYGVCGSLAYDFRPQGNENPGQYSGKTAQKQKKKTKCKAGVSPALAVSAALCTALLFSAVMAQSEIIVLSDKAHTARTEIVELLEEQARLKIEHAIAFAPAETERYATEVLGMVKPGAQQIYYIEVPESVPTDGEMEEKTEAKGLEELLRAYFPG